jgi:hypothetical protein
MLQRIWTGIVGGVAGVAIGFGVAIVLAKHGMTPTRIVMMCAACGAIGLIVGFVLAKPKKPSD